MLELFGYEEDFMIIGFIGLNVVFGGFKMVFWSEWEIF